ncbi:MAG: hypothetical protein COV44_05495 [Deltaproteobacteria bacterium CG11_big_fil_rev_8_21_14_0_20_45_16]|nr:MAG: hypothetical protein COV44_05495 [Deltaproteobacteria bacterium CG11_big_fil_rev_8_21_14_0_20_45_16]
MELTPFQILIGLNLLGLLLLSLWVITQYTRHARNSQKIKNELLESQSIGRIGSWYHYPQTGEVFTRALQGGY